MTWGKGIIIALSTFIVFITVLVVLFFMNRVDLVASDYYEQEINYEADINAKLNWQNAGAEFSFIADDENLALLLPEGIGVDEFVLELKRPNDMKQDLRYEIKSTHTFLIARKDLKDGLYEFRISGQAEDTTYLVTGKYFLK